MNYRRPSKSQIVEKALDWVNQSISREERYRYQILQLQRENKRLLVQCMHQENVSAPAALPLNPAPASIMYADFTTENNNGWSNDSHLLTITPQMTPCTSTEDLSKQEFGEEDDNASSGNEDDIDYRSSPYQCKLIIVYFPCIFFFY